eukprot:3939975-Rhodomonas_salina.2
MDRTGAGGDPLLTNLFKLEFAHSLSIQVSSSSLSAHALSLYSSGGDELQWKAHWHDDEEA